MNIQESKLKGLSECRFGSVIFLFRMAGIPLKMKKLKPIYTLYMVTVTIFSCSTFIAVSVDEFIHKKDLRRAMTTIRVLLSITNVMWIFSYFR
jgi:O-antigen ligase